MSTSLVPAVNGCGVALRPYTFSPLGLPAFGSNDVTLRRYNRTSLTQRPLLLACKANGQTSLVRSRNMSKLGACHVVLCLHVSGKKMNNKAATSSMFSGQQVGGTPHLHDIFLQKRRSFEKPAAVYNDVFKFRYPQITEKPEWWWRTLACIPYLLALQISDAGYYIHPLLKHYEFMEELVFFVPGAIKRLPPWFIMVYFFFSYIGIVKNKNWPHYFRFHLMMGMLMETGFQILCCTCNFFPLIHYNGSFGMYFCAALGFALIGTLLYCIRCALAGKYAELPFVSEAAYVHTLFNIGNFQNPF